MLLSAFENEFCNSSLGAYYDPHPHTSGSTAPESPRYDESHDWLKFLLTGLGITLTVVYALLILRTMRLGRASCKFYAFLLNRCLGDLLFLLFYTAVLFARREKVKEGALGSVSMVMGATFWTTAVSYTSLSLLKLYAVARPIEYRRKVTIQRCVSWIVISWVVVFCTVVTKIIAAHIFRTEASFLDGFGCNATNCHWYICQVMGSIYVLLYVATLVIFFATAIYIRRGSHVSGLTVTSSCSKPQLNQRRGIPLAKLTINVASLAVLHLPLALLCAYYAFAIGVFWNGTWPCYPLPRVNFVMLLKTVMVYPMLARIILDSLIGLATDRELRRSLRNALGGVASQSSRENSEQHIVVGVNCRLPSPKISAASAKV